MPYPQLRVGTPVAGGISTENLVKYELAAPAKRSRKPLWITLGALLSLVVIGGVVVGVLISQHIINIGSGSTTSDDSSGSSPGSNGGSPAATGTAGGNNPPQQTGCPTSDDIPEAARGTYLDTSSWYDLTDFNCTYTNETVGDLPITGLFSEWDDSTAATSSTPPLNKAWGAYTSLPIRGVNLGGWLSLEPFITPSLFDYPSSLGIVDEYTLCEHLGPANASATLEKHYATFITEADFKAIAAAGLDHVRIPYSYWAVETYAGDPYVFRTSWRYLLRGIEWARKYGLRVNLDLHAVPGSQNGWNHSGRQGTVNWIIGTNGALNAQRSLDIHNRLSQFFAQDRYKNVIVFYGLVNEPAISVPMDALVNWTSSAYSIIHGNGVAAPQIFSEALRGLPAWHGELTGYGSNLVVDVHEYAIFDDYLISMKHATKADYPCATWQPLMKSSMATSTGFGPTMVGEWSQADTDCAPALNGVGQGARWIGTFSDTLGEPRCPALDNTCTCDPANAVDPSSFSADYKTFLLTWAEAQMDAFESSWGWFYWTWKTESAPLWSYSAALAGGFMPANPAQRSWSCSSSVPSFGSLSETF